VTSSFYQIFSSLSIPFFLFRRSLKRQVISYHVSPPFSMATLYDFFLFIKNILNKMSFSN